MSMYPHAPNVVKFRVTLTVYIFERAYNGSLVPDMHIRYTPEAARHAMRVDWDVIFDLGGVLKAVQPIIVATIRRESERLLQVMKRYVETRPEDDNQ